MRCPRLLSLSRARPRKRNARQAVVKNARFSINRIGNYIYGFSSASVNIHWSQSLFLTRPFEAWASIRSRRPVAVAVAVKMNGLSCVKMKNYVGKKLVFLRGGEGRGEGGEKERKGKGKRGREWDQDGSREERFFNFSFRETFLICLILKLHV